MLEVDIVKLKPGVHTFTLHPAPEALDLDAARFRDIEVDLRLDLKPDQVFARFDVATTATLECDRTLVLFDQRLEGSYEVLFAQDEDPEADIRPLPKEGEPLDLTEPVRDTILLAVPARCIAPEAEALEIPTRFGAPEAGGDPRWEALRQLRQDEGNVD